MVVVISQRNQVSGQRIGRVVCQHGKREKSPLIRRQLYIYIHNEHE